MNRICHPNLNISALCFVVSSSLDTASVFKNQRAGFQKNISGIFAVFSVRVRANVRTGIRNIAMGIDTGQPDFPGYPDVNISGLTAFSAIPAP